MATQAQALAKAGRRLHEEAKEHMRSSRYHRRRAAQLHSEVEALRADLTALGVELVLDDKPQSHRRTSGTSRNGS
jgi:hypothetical protein